MTSGLYRTETSCLGLADFGRPRRLVSGTIDLSCFEVNGSASGSPFAAATSARSSSIEGIKIERDLDTLDIVVHLAPSSAAKTDHSPDGPTLYEGNVVQDVCFGCQGDHSEFRIIESLVKPDQCGFPVEIVRQRQRHSVLCTVDSVFRRIELDTRSLL